MRAENSLNAVTWPNNGKTVAAARIVVGALFLSLLAQLKVALPFTPVPITGQTFGLLIIVGMMRPGEGSLGLLTYLLFGALGLPVFAGGSGGWAYFAGPTGGYLLGFLIAAFYLQHALERHRPTFGKTLQTFALAHLPIYFCGIAWLSFYLPVEKLFIAGVLPFLLGDTVKCLLATYLVYSRIKRSSCP